MPRIRIQIFLAVLVISGCASSPSPVPAQSQAYAFISTPNTCTILVGGAGTVTKDSTVNANWFKIDQVLSNDLVTSLRERGYTVISYITDTQGDERFKEISAQVFRLQCNKVIQVTHLLAGGLTPSGDLDPTDKSGLVKSFGFELDILGLSADRPSPKFTSEYKKIYRYPLTSEMMQSLSMSVLARQMADAVESAHSLNKTLK